MPDSPPSEAAAGDTSLLDRREPVRDEVLQEQNRELLSRGGDRSGSGAAGGDVLQQQWSLMEAWHTSHTASASQLLDSRPESLVVVWWSPSAPLTMQQGISLPPSHLQSSIHPSNNLASHDVPSASGEMETSFTTVRVRIDFDSYPSAGSFGDVSVLQDSPPTGSAFGRLFPSTENITAPPQPIPVGSSIISIASDGPLMPPFSYCSHSNQGVRASLRHGQLEVTAHAGPSRAHQGFSSSQSQETEQVRPSEFQRNEETRGVPPRRLDDVSRRVDDLCQQQPPDLLPMIEDWFGNPASPSDRAPATEPRAPPTEPASSDAPQGDTTPPHFGLGDAYITFRDLLFGQRMQGGVPRFQVEDLVTYKFKPEARDEAVCAVCQDKFESEELVRVLHCGHEFHASCVDQWLEAHHSCPLCRKDATGAGPSSAAY